MIKLLKCTLITLIIIDFILSLVDEIKDYKKLKKEFKGEKKYDKS